MAAAILGIALWYQPVINTNRGMRARKLELEQKIAAETETARKLEAALRAMQDPKNGRAPGARTAQLRQTGRRRDPF